MGLFGRRKRTQDGKHRATGTQAPPQPQPVAQQPAPQTSSPQSGSPQSAAPQPAAPAAASSGSDLAALTGDYVIDPVHSEVGFVAKHAMVTNVRGTFDDFSGSLHLDGADPARSTAELTIQVASVDTRQAQRDEHLRTGDFFDAANHPEITFRSTSAAQTSAEGFRMSGDLTIKGVTQPVDLDIAFNGTAEDPYGNTRVGFEGEVVVERSKWGLTYNASLETGGVLLGERVRLVFDVSAVKKP